MLSVWLEKLPVGETGLANEWRARYHAETGEGDRFSDRTFGSALSSHTGRLVSRKKGRTGIFTYTRIALAPPAPPA